MLPIAIYILSLCSLALAALAVSLTATESTRVCVVSSLAAASLPWLAVLV